MEKQFCLPKAEMLKRSEDLKTVEIPNQRLFIHFVYQQYKDRNVPGENFVDYFQRVTGWTLHNEEKEFVRQYPVNSTLH